MLEQRRWRMDIIFIALIVFVGFFALSIFQIIRQGISLQSIASAVIAGAMFLLVLVVYLDVTDFRSNFEDSEKLFLFQDGSNKLIAGFSGVLTEESVPQFLDAPTLAKKQAEYDMKDIEAFVGSYYKVFVLSEDVFASFDVGVTYGNVTLTQEDILSVMGSMQPTSAFADTYLRELSMPDPTGALKAKVIDDLRREAPDDASMRGLLFAQLFSEGFEQKGSNFLIFGIAADQIKVFRETPLFLLIRYTPPSLLEQVAQTGGRK